MESIYPDIIGTELKLINETFINEIIRTSEETDLSCLNSNSFSFYICETDLEN